MPDPLLLPRRQRGDIEPLGVLATPDPLPPSVAQALDDLARGVAAGQSLPAAEHPTLALGEQSEPGIHRTSIPAQIPRERPHRRSVDNHPEGYPSVLFLLRSYDEERTGKPWGYPFK
jgi:hypothetical protein